MQRTWMPILVIMLIIAACAPDDGGTNDTPQTRGPRPPAGYEIYTENGGVDRPNNAIDVFIVYSPESQSYMPEIITNFNQSYTAGNHPITGQPLADGERPIYVWGTDPVSGSSGTVMQGIVNAITNPGDSNIYRPTIFQPSVGHWLALANYYSNTTLFNISDARATAISPVVIATWQSRLNALTQTLGTTDIGWQDLLRVLNSPNGWCDFGLEDCRRAVYYGHADPNHSSTGLSTTIAQYYACATQNGITGRSLSVQMVNNSDVQDCVLDIQRLVKHYSRRTEDFLEYIELGPDFLDFLAMEEADIICINTGGSQGGVNCQRPPQGDKLVAIYPEEGTYWHEHPFGIVQADWVTPEQREAARIFTDYVLSEEPQRRIMREGFRPANPAVPLEYPFVEENGVDPDGPASILDVPDGNAVVRIQENWGVVKKRADVVLLVDVSGSMQQDNKIGLARDGIGLLMQNMSSANRVSMISFSDIITVWDSLDAVESSYNSILWHTTCEQPEGYNPQPTSISFYGQCLYASGPTSLFTATRIGVDILDHMSNDDDRIRIVLLLSDGQDACEAEGCSTLDDVISKIETTYQSKNPVIVVPIAYGNDADMRTLRAIADASRTQVISGNVNNILEVLTQLSGYF